MSAALLVEFDADNRNPYFPPLERVMRGAYSSQIAVRRDKDAGAVLAEFPEPIPGQQLAVNVESGDAAILEPLHDPRFAAIADRIKGRGIRLPEQRESVKCDLPTLIHWIKEAVEAKQARVVSGSLPDKIEGKPRLHFIVQPRESSEAKLAAAIDRMAAAQEQQTEAITKLLAALAAKK
jgi:hypothetical protein